MIIFQKTSGNFNNYLDGLRFGRVHFLQFRKYDRAPRAQEVWRDGPDLLMPLNENRVELTAKRLIACRDCHAIANVSMNNSNINLICPGCYKLLGGWATSSEAVADIDAFVANSLVKKNSTVTEQHITKQTA